MMRASVGHGFADFLVAEMHNPNVQHYDGWAKSITEGWTLRRLGPGYVLYHGRARVGTVCDVRRTDTHLAIEMTNGLTCCYRVRQTRGGRRTDKTAPTTRQAVEDAVRAMPRGVPFTSRMLADMLPYTNGPTVRQVSNILAHGDVAEYKDGLWYPRGVF